LEDKRKYNKKNPRSEWKIIDKRGKVEIMNQTPNHHQRASQIRITGMNALYAGYQRSTNKVRGGGGSEGEMKEER
jgi:hypothetical protein